LTGESLIDRMASGPEGQAFWGSGRILNPSALVWMSPVHASGGTIHGCLALAGQTLHRQTSAAPAQRVIALALLLVELGLQRRRELLHDVLALAENHTMPEGPELSQDGHIGLDLECGALRRYFQQGQGEFHFHLALDEVIPARRGMG
jgi:hypothetical protein